MESNDSLKESSQLMVKERGTGIIFVMDILTNASLVENADNIIVNMSDGFIVGEIVGIDFSTDLAIIRLKANNDWPTAKLGNSDNIKVGDWAIAVGNPLLEDRVRLEIGWH